MTLVSGTITGRFVSMCGQIGVMQIAGTEGKMMGPPADSEYAVDPVGVEMMRPSALYAHMNCPSTCVSRSIMRASADFASTASFNASKDETVSPARTTSVESSLRFAMR